MSEQDHRRIVEQFWAAVSANDWNAHDRLIDDGYVQEWAPVRRALELKRAKS